MAHDLCFFYKSTCKSYLNFLYKYWRTQKAFSEFMTTYILFVGTSSTHQWVRVIPGQINLVKKVNIHVDSIEVRYLSLIPIVNPFNASVYWPFQGSASFVDPFRYLCSMLCHLLCSLWPCAACWVGLVSWLSCVWCLLVFLSLSHVVPRVGCGAWLYHFLICVFFFTFINTLFK